MFAIVQAGATQYAVSEKDEILVDHLGIETGKNYKFEKVLLYSDVEGKKVLLGTPYLENVTVEARVLGDEKGEKIRVFKMKAKKRYRKTQGHRSHFTRLKILKINILSGSKKAAIQPEAVSAPEVEAPVVKKVTKKAAAKK